MPIEFACPKCAKQLKVPDGSAGAKCQCPACGQAQSVPASRAKSNHDTTSVSRDQPLSDTPAEDDGRLRVRCTHCDSKHICDRKLEGTKGQCRTCRAIFLISADRDKQRAAETAVVERWVFNCAKCEHLFEGKPEMAGVAGKCPECNAVFEIMLRKADKPKKRPAKKSRSARKPEPKPAAVPPSDDVYLVEPIDEPSAVVVTPVHPSDSQPASSSAPPPLPVAAQPVTVQPVTVQPVTVQPVTVQPVTVQPVTVQPVTVQPVTVQPVTVQPVTVQPVVAQPVVSQPVTVQPIQTPRDQPIHVTPVTVQPIQAPRDQPVHVTPVTVQPVQAQPVSQARSFKIACPTCQCTLNVATAMRGKNVRCPQCQNAIRVP